MLSYYTLRGLAHFINHNMRDEKYFYLTRDKKCYVMLYAAGTLK